MKLTRIETKGFKSFANQISLSFDGGVVGIVGPNGSGKSNINDAIKWVLGEQSIKSLRGDSSEDVIFAGSKMEQAAQKAEVTLHFDNSAGTISLPHAKISITRVVERGKSGNKYFINGEPARLKDIREIATESGIGKSSLAIVSQGTIAEIAKASPEERRVIFEDVAGVAKFKLRKKETMRKLDQVTVNLEKIHTITEELERQLKPLKRQADKAKVYLEKKEELKGVELGVINDEITRYSAAYESLKEELADSDNTKNETRNRINTISNNISEKNSFKLKNDRELQDLRKRQAEIHTQISDIRVKKANEEERRRLIISGEIQAESKVRVATMKQELETLSNKISVSTINKEELENKNDELRKEANKVQEEERQLKYEIDSLKNKVSKAEYTLSSLKDNRDNKSNLYKGVKTIVANKGLFQGYVGLVSEQLEVEEQYSSAIETILSNSMQHIVVKESSDAVKAVNFLKQNRAGRATFIPLRSIKPKFINEQHMLVAPTLEGYVGVASDLVKTSNSNIVLKEFLLGNIIIADTVQNASSIAKSLNNRYMVVSLDGDVIRAGGVVSGGEKQRKASNALNLNREIERLEKTLPTMQENLQKLKNRLVLFENSLNEKRSIIGSNNTQIFGLRTTITMSKDAYNDLKIKYEEASNETFETENEVSFETIDQLEKENLQIKVSIQSKEDLIAEVQVEIAKLEQDKHNFERILNKVIEESSEKTSQKHQTEFMLKNNRERLAQEYNLLPENITEYKLELPIEEAKEIVNNIRREIRDLGNVNVDAIKQYEELNERYEDQKAKEEELFKAQQIIISAIDQMNTVILDRITSTIKEVNVEFRNVFTTMFGGGDAEIKFSDPSNKLESGVDVIAQPPGKTVKNINLFSGGEKAMIAISLLFAILKAKPIPLCILDEVEAALDEANVIRFADYLQELKEQTQFLVVTHRVGTMSRVDHLFGATMQKRGVTSFFTVKLDEAKELLD